MAIEAARDREGDQPAVSFLLGFADSKSKKKRRIAADVEALFEDWSTGVVLEPKTRQRHLEGDLWEVKTPDVRLPYYEVVDPDHGRLARLTHGFLKDFGRTIDGKCPPKQIRKGLYMMKEDKLC